MFEYLKLFLLFFWQTLFVYPNCKDTSLLIITNSGPIQGRVQKTIIGNVPFVSYIGIPYAEAPIAELRFREPKPVKQWTKTMITTNEYRNACLPTYNMMHIMSSRSEDCLYLNIYTPDKICNNEKIPVMIYIPGGGFFDGDGSNEYYGPDLLMMLDHKMPDKNKKIIFVTMNYRLGPFGFLNLDEPGLTGNMGFKDQQLAIEWVYNNIEFFGGNNKYITLIGESAGSISVHYHLFNPTSSKMIHNAIMMSGVYFDYCARMEEENHREMMLNIFSAELNGTKNVTKLIEVLNVMDPQELNRVIASNYVIIKKNGVSGLAWTATIEDEKKATKPFLTQPLRKIYNEMIAAGKKLEIDVMFGFVSAESINATNSVNPYDFVPIYNSIFSNIDFPFHRLQLPKNSIKHIELAQKVRKFYFKNEPIEPNAQSLNAYIQMMSDMNMAYGIDVAVKLHSRIGKTYYYLNDIQRLGLNYIWLNKQNMNITGMAHHEDILYIFYSKLYKYLYESADAPTLNAVNFMTEFMVDFATDNLKGFQPVQGNDINSILISNDGIFPSHSPNKEAFEMWAEIQDALTPYIDVDYN